MQLKYNRALSVKSVKQASMRFFAVFLCLALTACGVSKQSTTTHPSAPSTPSTPPPTANTQVVFIGDSVTMLWGQQPAFQAHTNWTSKGISGEQSTLIAMRFQKDVIALHPDEVHIIMGTNDVYPGWTLCATNQYSATATTPPNPLANNYQQDTCSNYLYMVETAKRNNIKIVIGTIPPWGCATDPVCGLSTADETQARYDRINQLNTWLNTFAAKEGVTLIDYHTALANQEGLHYSDGLTADGVHPDASGFSIMQPLVESKLQQLQ